MTSNAIEATSQASILYLRASRRYLTAVYRISSAASRSPRQAPGPASCKRINRARSPSGLSNPWLAGPAGPAVSSLAGVMCSSTVTPPRREVRHQHPRQDARQDAAVPAARQQMHHVARGQGGRGESCSGDGYGLPEDVAARQRPGGDAYEDCGETPEERKPGPVEAVRERGVVECPVVGREVR